MAHSHNHSHHGHSHSFEESTETRLWISLFLNLGISVAQLIGGFISNSLALISDAVHNLSDTGSIGISLVARKYAVKSATTQKTFGYRRADIIGAFINLIILVIVSLFLIKEGMERFFAPETIDGALMFWIALVGLVGNVVSVILLHAGSKRSLNIKSTYIHLIWDAAASLAVIIGGVLVLYFDFYIIDPILTIAIALYILYTSYELLRQTIDILMESVPADINVREIKRELEQIPRVLDIHHVHVWNLDEHQMLLECHARIDEEEASNLEEIKNDIKEKLEVSFQITHSTIEFELKPCRDRTHSS